MTLKYAPNVRNGVSAHVPEGWGKKDWHQSATGDAGTSHTLPGRLYVVQCEWCPDAFGAYTKAEAMAMFRRHEKVMLTDETPHA